MAAGFRSGFEQRFHELRPHLKYEELVVEYDVIETRKYTPDFVDEETGTWYETKGRFTAVDRKKMLNVRKAYPNQRIVFVFQQPYNKLTKAPASQTYSEWATRNGFEWMSMKDVLDGKE